MRHLLTVISIVLASGLGPAIAQNKSTPKPEDAEKNAFETPTAGKSATDTLKNTKDQSSDRNPESRLNDDRQPPEGSPKRPKRSHCATPCRRAHSICHAAIVAIAHGSASYSIGFDGHADAT
jgi:hypothetical protein